MEFPKVIFVSHYDHSTEESPSLGAHTKAVDAIDDEQEHTEVAEYQLVKVRKLKKEVKEVV